MPPDSSLMLSHDSQHLLHPGPSGTLADAAAYLRHGLCADGAADGTDDDFSGPERQWAALTEWAGSAGKILPLAFPPPEREGGREHDVTLDEASGRWIKYTKPSSSGYTVSWSEHGEPYMHNATPLEYLQRLLWQNEVFGDAIHLVGLWQQQPHQWRIVTTQPGLQGERTTLETLASAFTESGFTLLPWRGIGYEGSLSLRIEGFDIWDVHPANVLLSPEGIPLPFDVIVTQAKDEG